MITKNFKTWLVYFFLNITLIIIGMHITNLGYQEEKPPHFTKLPNDNTEKSNKILVILNISTVFLETNNQDLLDLINLDVKQTTKKQEKAKRCRQRKINLV